MEDLLFFLFGLGMFYSVIHFAIIQHTKSWNWRSGYEKFVSIVAMVTIALIFLGVMFE